MNEEWSYLIVSGRGPKELAEAVNEEIASGFHPIGGPMRDGEIYYQAMWDGEYFVVGT